MAARQPHWWVAPWAGNGTGKGNGTGYNVGNNQKGCVDLKLKGRPDI